MKDSDDSPWFNIAQLQEYVTKGAFRIWVFNRDESWSSNCIKQRAKDSIYSGRRLFLFFEERVKDIFEVGNKVYLRFGPSFNN